MLRHHSFLYLLQIGFLCCMIREYEGYSTSPPPPTTLPPPTTSTECTPGAGTQRDCYSYYCYQGFWQRFELMRTEECCRKHDHPACRELFPELFETTEPEPTPAA